MQRCHGHASTRAIACLRPSWASETHRRTPSRPRRAQRAQELAPERLGLDLADVEADHLAAAGLVHAVGDHQRLRDHVRAVAHLLLLGVQPQIRVGALQRPLPERRHLLVQAPAQPADLVLAHPHPELLDHAVDLARGDAVDIGLLDDRDQRLLGAPARLQKAREVRRARTQLRDRQLELADARVPRRARGSRCAASCAAPARARRARRRPPPPPRPPSARPTTPPPSRGSHPRAQTPSPCRPPRAAVILRPSAIGGAPFDRTAQQPDDSRPAMAVLFRRPSGLLHHFYRLDPGSVSRAHPRRERLRCSRVMRSNRAPPLPPSPIRLEPASGRMAAARLRQEL